MNTVRGNFGFRDESLLGKFFSGYLEIGPLGARQAQVPAHFRPHSVRADWTSELLIDAGNNPNDNIPKIARAGILGIIRRRKVRDGEFGEVTFVELFRYILLIFALKDSIPTMGSVAVVTVGILRASTGDDILLNSGPVYLGEAFCWVDRPLMGPDRRSSA